MTNPTFTVTARGREIEFTSAFPTLAEAYKALDAHPDTSEFAESLLLAARQRRLSPKQVGWLHKLATDSRVPVTDRYKVDGLNLSKIIEIFDHAHQGGEGKKYPKIVLAEAFDDDRVEVTCKIVRCGSQSKYEGAANIKTANDEWAGRINRDGSVTCGNRANFGEVEAILRELAKDPLQVLAQNGVATSQCCYCARALTTRQSREVGYGPICADKHGLPWGKTSRVDKESEDAQVISRTPQVAAPWSRHGAEVK